MIGLGARQRFGRYVAIESPLHMLDPTIKIVVFMVVIVSIFLASAWLHLAYVSIYIVLLCILSKVKFRFYVESLKSFVWMFALSFAINVVFPRGDRASAFSFPALNIAGIFSLRLALMIIAATILTMVMCPSEIADSVTAFARLRGKAGRTAADFASLLSISLRFVPVMFEEAERIKAAQVLRGQSTSGLVNRVRFVVGLIVPLVESSLRRATNLGFALEARCYGYHIPRSAGMRFGRSELIFTVTAVSVLMIVLLLR